MDKIRDNVSNSGQSRVIVIVRGIPGSGKSTFVNRVLNNIPAVICNADEFRIENGEYVYRKEDNKKVHALCLDKFTKAVNQGKPYIIVDNTNLQSWEFKEYLRIGEENGYICFVVAMRHPKPEVAAERNVHNVPLEQIQKMMERFKP